MKDRRAEPRIKERVPYVITTGPPGVPLIRLVRTPQEFLDTPGSLINTEYYITRAIIPALQRCFILMNVSVLSWLEISIFLVPNASIRLFNLILILVQVYGVTEETETKFTDPLRSAK